MLHIYSNITLSNLKKEIENIYDDDNIIRYLQGKNSIINESKNTIIQL